MFHRRRIVKRGPSPTVHFSHREKEETERGTNFLHFTGEEQYEAVHKKQSKLGTGRWGCLGRILSLPACHLLAVWLGPAPLLPRVIFILNKRRIFFFLPRISKVFSVPFSGIPTETLVLAVTPSGAGLRSVSL